MYVSFVWLCDVSFSPETLSNYTFSHSLLTAANIEEGMTGETDYSGCTHKHEGFKMGLMDPFEMVEIMYVYFSTYSPAGNGKAGNANS